VHGIVCSLPCGQMALRISAIRRRNRQSIVVVDVAQGACHASVPFCQRESCAVVVKHSSRPCRNWMASCAGGSRRGETGGDMIRDRAANRCGALESRRVAPVTVGRIQRVVVADVA
jgi:hypothetical protein